jgi:hypothetical protein
MITWSLWIILLCWAFNALGAMIITSDTSLDFDNRFYGAVFSYGILLPAPFVLLDYLI